MAIARPNNNEEKPLIIFTFKRALKRWIYFDRTQQ